MKLKALLGTLLILAAGTSFCYAQEIVPIETHRFGSRALAGCYLKDVNHVLEKFEGVWKGTCEIGDCKGFRYEVRIKKYYEKTIGMHIEDGLFLRYRVWDAQGKEIYSTLDIADDNHIEVVKSLCINDNAAKNCQLSYYGAERMGMGDMLLKYRDERTLELRVAPGEMERNDILIFPNYLLDESVLLTKQ